MKYTAINIGPIITTFTMARKPREFWIASYMFSHLMKCLIMEISKETKLMSPYMPLNEEKAGIGLFPDRAFFKYENSPNIDLLTNQGLVRFACDIKMKVQTVIDYFNIMTISMEANSDNEAISELNKHLNFLELTTPTRSSETNRIILEYLKMKENSPLFNIAFGKNVFEIDTLDEIARRQLMLGSIPKKSYHDYVCIVQADGDTMGAVVTHLPDNELINFSEDLMKFGKSACQRVSNFGGLPIYAGGDDLLFIVPVVGLDSSSVFDLIKSIDKTYQDIIDKVNAYNLTDEDGKKIRTSMSYGISITYYKYPLYETWAIARNQLFDKSKLVKSKNALSWKLQKHSGSSFENSFSKNSVEIYNTFLDLVKIHVDERFVSAVAHKIRANEALLQLFWGNEHFKERINSFFEKIIDVDGKDTSGIQYLEKVKALLILMFQEKKMQNQEKKEENKSNKVAGIVSTMYNMLRTAKFINGEEDEK